MAASTFTKTKATINNYQKGAYALIPIHWDEAAKTLSIGDRKGQYPGMPEKRVFNIVWVSQGHGVGESVEPRIDKVLPYDGHHISIKNAVIAEATVRGLGVCVEIHFALAMPKAHESLRERTAEEKPIRPLGPEGRPAKRQAQPVRAGASMGG